ncbi:MAG: class II glutamine amidotransferase [Eubacterium sp.]|nr:class II glutamine amidotransferase [Eubacterium sp.]
MCELFGFTSEHEADLRGYLTEFYSHSIRHPHGWGMATYQNGKLNIVTEPVCANKSKIIADIIDRLPKQNNLIGHIRLATVGTLDKTNCHPFVKTDSSGREWVLAHNGTIFSGMALIKYNDLQTGNTDSERILMYFIDNINEAAEIKGAPLDETERCKVIESSIAAITRRNKVNLILFDGELYYVHANMKGTLFYKQEDGSVTFGTVPYDDTGWKPVELCRLFVYKNGGLFFTGNSHGNEYVESISLIANDMEFNL